MGNCNWINNNNNPYNNLNGRLILQPYSFNQGAIGLPGDYSSASRFVKCLYVKSNLILDCLDGDYNDFFKCLDSVSMIKGSVKTERGYEITRYSVCYDLNKKILLYKTYFNSCLSEIKMNEINTIQRYPLINKMYIYKQN